MAHAQLLNLSAGYLAVHLQQWSFNCPVRLKQQVMAGSRGIAPVALGKARWGRKRAGCCSGDRALEWPHRPPPHPRSPGSGLAGQRGQSRAEQPPSPGFQTRAFPRVKVRNLGYGLRAIPSDFSPVAAAGTKQRRKVGALQSLRSQ